MATIVIENVPDNMVKKYGTKISYSEIEIKPKKLKKDPTIRLQKLVDDPENTRYGPFDNIDDFLNHIHSNKD